ncbi:unnamed protein product, partial [marine sediment metagenome]
MSIKITRTCISFSKAKYSAVVNAILGIINRSIIGEDGLNY